MEEKKLYIGQTVFLICDNKLDDPIIVTVVEDRGESKLNQGREYRLIDDYGKEYYINYPMSINDSFVVTRSAYIAYLERKKEKALEALKKAENDINQANRDIISVKKICQTHSHDFGEWEDKKWITNTIVLRPGCDPNKDTSYDVVYQYGKCRICKVCGTIENLVLDNQAIEKRR